MQYSAIKKEDNWRDGRSLQEIEYFQSLYPERMKRMRTYVAAECDKMDYPGSPIYDEFPDQMMIDRMCENICRNIPAEMENAMMESMPMPGMMDNRMGMMDNRGEMMDNCRGKMCSCGEMPMREAEIYELMEGQQLGFGESWWDDGRDWRDRRDDRRDNRRDRRHPIFINDMIRILLLNELQRRRCRFGRCI